MAADACLWLPSRSVATKIPANKTKHTSSTPIMQITARNIRSHHDFLGYQSATPSAAPPRSSGVASSTGVTSEMTSSEVAVPSDSVVAASERMPWEGVSGMVRS